MFHLGEYMFSGKHMGEYSDCNGKVNEEVEKLHLRIYCEALEAGDWPSVEVMAPLVGNKVSYSQFRSLVRKARRGSAMNEEIALSEETLKLVESRSREGCASCGLILVDFKKNGKLTDMGNYPIEAKVCHISAEKEGKV